MQLDDFYNEMITVFEVFGAEMKKVKFECKFENRGFFRLEYMYCPNNYRIIIENEYRTYDIDIVDAENASNSLYRICKFKNSLAKADIESAVRLLKETLEKILICILRKRGSCIEKTPWAYIFKKREIELRQKRDKSLLIGR